MGFVGDSVDTLFGEICDDLHHLIAVYHGLPSIHGQLRLIGSMLDEVEREIVKEKEMLND